MFVRDRILNHPGLDPDDRVEIAGLLAKYRQQELVAFVHRLHEQLRGCCLECDGCVVLAMSMAEAEGKVHGE
jgi:hypothetical protein